MIYRGIISAISSFRGSVNKGRAWEHLFAFKLVLKVNKVRDSLFNNTAGIVVYACVLQPRAQIFATPWGITVPPSYLRNQQNSTDTEFDWYRIQRHYSHPTDTYGTTSTASALHPSGLFKRSFFLTYKVLNGMASSYINYPVRYKILDRKWRSLTDWAWEKAGNIWGWTIVDRRTKTR